MDQTKKQRTTKVDECVNPFLSVSGKLQPIEWCRTALAPPLNMPITFALPRRGIGQNWGAVVIRIFISKLKRQDKFAMVDFDSRNIKADCFLIVKSVQYRGTSHTGTVGIRFCAQIVIILLNTNFCFITMIGIESHNMYLV